MIVLLALAAGFGSADVPVRIRVPDVSSGDSGPFTQGLRTEYLTDPLGIDAARPRLSWSLSSRTRGEAPTGFQVLVASSLQALKQNRGDLWDSGKVRSTEIGVTYAGKPLSSGDHCFWKVRTWGATGHAGPWSRTGTWNIGLLHRSDWKAQWITSPTLADPANRPRTPINCYRSELSTNPNARKWITLDLGASRQIDRIELAPARPEGLTFDIGTVQFPRRFRLLASDSPDFKNAKVLTDQTKADYPNSRLNICEFKFPELSARYIRLDVTRLGPWDASDFGIFLSRFSAFSGSENVSVGANVTASDSIEAGKWSKKFLVEAKSHVEFDAFPKALDPKAPGAFSSSRTTQLQKDFRLDAPVRKATLYGTAKGFYEARINGQKVGDALLTPGFTDFHQRVSYQTTDVTALLHKGNNRIGALLGYGWYAGHMNLAGNGYFYGYFPQLAAQLDIELTNGKHLTICTDKSWQTTLDGPVRWSDLLDGEAIDFRKGPQNWQPAWSQALGSEQFVAQKMPPVKEIQAIKPVGRKQIRPGVWVYDLGQEITGWVRLKASGPAGTHIVVRHTEAAKPNGELDDASLWGTLQRDDYILDGKAPRTLQPHFTYHGFRYFEISGIANPEDVVAINIHNDLKEIGDFECSNPLFNRLMTASKWTQRNLLFDVPAGCAARSERLAWTGDIRPCVQTALFNFDSAAFFEKYAADLRDDQQPDGRFTDIAPHAHLMGTDICVGSPGWADAGVSLPWEVYVNTGDRQLLAQHYEAARKWVDFIHRHNPDLIWRAARGQDWGDWLSAGLATPKELGATAFFAHSTDLVARMAQVLGRKQEADQYKALFNRIKAAFIAQYVSPDGVIAPPSTPQNADVTSTVQRLVQSGPFTVNNDSMGLDPARNVAKKLRLKLRRDGVESTRDYAEDEKVNLAGTDVMTATYGTFDTREADAQGSYALALHFNLLDEPLRVKATKRLLAVIKRDGSHPATGFWSSIELPLALSNSGEHETASALVDLKTFPSWGYMLESGGTTFWEAFDADKKTLSLNHWTHSASGEWLWRNVAGLSPDADNPGYKSFTVRPRPTKEVTWCRAEYRSIRGPIKIDWKVEGTGFTLALQVPVGSVAHVYFPGVAASVRETGTPVGQTKGVRFLKMDGGTPVYEVRSGTYRFSATAP